MQTNQISARNHYDGNNNVPGSLCACMVYVITGDIHPRIECESKLRKRRKQSHLINTYVLIWYIVFVCCQSGVRWMRTYLLYLHMLVWWCCVLCSVCTIIMMISTVEMCVWMFTIHWRFAFVFSVHWYIFISTSPVDRTNIRCTQSYLYACMQYLVFGFFLLSIWVCEVFFLNWP